MPVLSTNPSFFRKVQRRSRNLNLRLNIFSDLIQVVFDTFFPLNLHIYLLNLSLFFRKFIFSKLVFWSISSENYFWNFFVHRRCIISPYSFLLQWSIFTYHFQRSVYNASNCTICADLLSPKQRPGQLRLLKKTDLFKLLQCQ